jgi:hypothetical protein
MNAFEQYVQQYHLEALTIATISQVRYLTVWNALKGKPITPAHAEKIRQGILQLTGVPYTGGFSLMPEPPLDQFPTLPLKQVKQEKGRRKENLLAADEPL